MNGLDATQLAQLHADLEAQRAELAALEPVEVPDGGHELAVPEVESSPADQATAQLLNDLAVGAAGHHVAQMAAIRHALAKFDARNDAAGEGGSYGLCEECGNAIGFSRLQARPEATLCIACQTRAEQR